MNRLSTKPSDRNKDKEVVVDVTAPTPHTLDWRELGCVTPVKHQVGDRRRAGEGERGRGGVGEWGRGTGRQGDRGTGGQRRGGEGDEVHIDPHTLDFRELGCVTAVKHQVGERGAGRWTRVRGTVTETGAQTG